MFSKKKNNDPNKELIKDNESAYLKYDSDNDEVVPVKKREKNTPVDDSVLHKKKKREDELNNEEKQVEKKKIGFTQWIWLAIIIIALFSYIQFSESLIKENQKILNVSNTTIEKVVPSETSTESNEKSSLLKGVLNTDEKEPETKTPDKLVDSAFDTIADLDKDYQMIVSSVRNNSEMYVNQEISSGQYQLNLETSILNLKHLKRDLYGYHDSFEEAKIVPLSDLMVQKTEDLDILIQDLKYAPYERVPESFNSFADLSKSRAKEYKNTFVEELKEHRYKVTIKQNKIVYSS